MSGVDERYIDELATDRRETYAKFQAEVKANRASRYMQDMKIEDIPEAYRTSTQITQLPRIPDILQRMSAICTDDDPVPSQPPQDETETAQLASSQVERWMAGARDRMLRDSDRDPWRAAMDAALGDGLGVMKLVDDRHAWDDQPKREYEEEDEKGEKVQKEKEARTYLAEIKRHRQSAPFPFIWSDIDCLNYFPVSTGRRVSEVLEVAKRPLLPTAKAIGVKPTSIGKDGKLRWKRLRMGERFNEDNLPTGSPSSVECRELWTPDKVYYTLDGEIVDQRGHDYKRPPYFHFGSYTTSAREPEHQFRSAISNVRVLVQSLNRWLTIASNWGYLAGFPFLVEDGTVPSNGAKKGELQVLEAGTILRGVKVMELPNINPVIDKMVGMLMGEIDRASLASVMYGSGAGTSSGYQVASLQAAAQSVLRPVLRNAGRALEDLFSFLLYLVEHVIADDVYVWGREGKKGSWLSLGPDDIKGYYALHVELKPLLPLDQIAQRQSALQMFKGGLWSPKKALQETGEEQPEEVLKEMWAYRWVDESGGMMKVAEDAARKMGLLKNEPEVPPQLPEAAMAPGPNGGAPMDALGLPQMGPTGPMTPGLNMPLRPTPPAMAGVVGAPDAAGME